MITIENDGPAIRATNYWASAHARRGYLFLSWNDGVARLLVPPAATSMLPDMETGRLVVISRGPWVEQAGRDALELLFDDGTDSPFSCCLVAEQCDRMLPDDEIGRAFEFHVWTRTGLRFMRSARYRRAPALPCLDPWGGA